MTATTGGQPTGTSAGGVSDYAQTAPNETRVLSLRADYLRTKVDMLGGEVQELHSEARELDLADRTLEKAKKSVTGLLEELVGDRGMGWSDIAEILGVSISAIRKWRKGGDASPASRLNLARIATLLDVLEQKGLVQDPASRFATAGDAVPLPFNVIGAMSCPEGNEFNQPVPTGAALTSPNSARRLPRCSTRSGPTGATAAAISRWSWTSTANAPSDHETSSTPTPWTRSNRKRSTTSAETSVGPVPCYRATCSKASFYRVSVRSQ